MRQHTVKIIVVFCFLAELCFSQGTFRNLDFENPTIALTNGAGPYPTDDALPGWTVKIGTIEQHEIYYDILAGNFSSVGLIGFHPAAQYSALDGQLSVILQCWNLTANPLEASISQTGLIPADARSLWFKAQPDLGVLQVSLGGQIVPIYAIMPGPNYTLYGGSIEQFANQNLELKFTSFGPAAPGAYYGWNLDSIMFLPESIPEPSSVSLFVCSLILLMLRPVAKKVVVPNS